MPKGDSLDLHVYSTFISCIAQNTVTMSFVYICIVIR